jgi:hypothetical protein
MHDPRLLAVTIAFVLAAPYAALGKEKKAIEVNSYSFGQSSTTTSGGSAGPARKAPTTTPAGTAGITPGWNTCTSGACPDIRSNPLGNNLGTSGAIAGSKAKLPK